MQAPNDKKGLPSWVRIGYAVLAALMALLAYRVGSIWAGHAVLILLTFFATWFASPKARRVVRFGHLLLSMTLLLATALILFLNAPEQAVTIESSQLLSFFVGGVAAKALVSIVAALLISALLLMAPILLVTYVSSEWILALHEVYGISRRQAMRLLLSLVFNTAYPYYFVEDGEITLTKPPGLLPKLGGPGIAVIRPYNAAAFELAGNITRIEGPGLVTTKRYESLKGATSLRKQWSSFTAESVLTKDHVPLTFHCGVGFRIESRQDTAKRVEEQSQAFEGSRFSGIIGGDYPVYKRTIYRAVYGTTETGWKLLSQGATETQLRAVLRQYRLEDLYRLENNELAEDKSVIDEIVDEVSRKINAISPTWGTTVSTFLIQSFDAPKDVEQKLLELWATPYRKQQQEIAARATTEAIRMRGEAEADAIAEVEKAKLVARENLIQVLTRSFLSGPAGTNVHLTERVISAVEKLSTALTTDTATAARYIEAIEKMATTAGTKVLMVGEQQRFLPRGDSTQRGQQADNSDGGWPAQQPNDQA
jgi:regulator of protease activity HflC (stomatin/prohibitin superfamily)